MDKTLQKILELISQKGISDKKFLTDNQFSLSTLSDWKSGRMQSYEKHIYKIAEYFNVSTDYLLGKTESPTATNDDNTDETQDPVFFRLKKGLESYNIDNEDIDFLLTVMKAHKERNK